MEGSVTCLAYYPVKLAECAIDVGSLGASIRPHMLQRKACPERTCCNAVQHAKVPGGPDILTRPAIRRVPDRGGMASWVVFR